jgi:hypothetical protein
MRIGQRPQQHGVDDAVDRRRQPDAEGQCHDDRERKRGVAPQVSRGIARILAHLIEPARHPHAAHVFLDARDVAELANRRRARLVLGHAAHDVVGGLVLDVLANLAIEVVEVGRPSNHVTTPRATRWPGRSSPPSTRE